MTTNLGCILYKPWPGQLAHKKLRVDSTDRQACFRSIYSWYIVYKLCMYICMYMHVSKVSV